MNSREDRQIKRWLYLPHLVPFILRLGDFVGYKILAINSLSSKMVTAAVVMASSHDHVVIDAATTIAPPKSNVHAHNYYKAQV